MTTATTATTAAAVDALADLHSMLTLAMTTLEQAGSDHFLSTVPLHVLLADNGMVVMTAGDRYRLNSASWVLGWTQPDGTMAAANWRNPAEAHKVARRWNDGLTTAQIETKCRVRVVTGCEAVEVAKRDVQALLDTFAAATTEQPA